MLLAQDLVARRRLRWTLQGLIVLLAAGVGASRVYLGVHWPSDVLGGYLLGILWVLEWRWLRERLPRGVVAKADGPPVGVV
jgi:membrane-associated phospholipid phosphatase